MAGEGALFRGPDLTRWDRARLNVVVPIGLIVTVAIICIVVAVVSSAQRADEVSLEQERQLFTRAVTAQGFRILREVQSAARSVNATGIVPAEIGEPIDASWLEKQSSQWLATSFDHDLVIVVDKNDGFHNSVFKGNTIGVDWLAVVRPELQPILDYVRGRVRQIPEGSIRLVGADIPGELGHGKRAAVVRHFLGRSAIVAAVEVYGQDLPENGGAPIIVTVKFIDQAMLDGIATRMQLKKLRRVSVLGLPPGPDEYIFALRDENDTLIDRFVWTPRKPGGEVVRSVIPFITLALGSFVLLVGFMLQYMRRTTAALEAGELRLRHLASHDPLCGLPNRAFFGEKLEQVIAEVKSDSEPAAVFCIDLDHFKEVNDTLGHPVGDELLRNVTLRLNKTMRSSDIVARLGGDEFAVITRSGADMADLQAIADRIIVNLSAPYTINSQSIVIGASIGIAIVDASQENAAPDIMRYADLALYRAKNEGRNRACIYDVDMDDDLSSRKILETELRDAIESQGLRLAYQAVVARDGESVVGVEALCRWTHPERGEIPPMEFIPVAEHSGLIIALGEWVLRRACLDGKMWPNVTVAVNVSPLQFRRADFVSVVERILIETEFDPTRLELEITESTFLGNIDATRDAMRRIKALGVRLALDDFGTGYSSLFHLRRFPFDKLKIDKSFIQSIDKASDGAIVHAVVSLGRGLGMTVTAEGVETAEQQLFLHAAGVHTMQGYRFGRPTSPLAISARLAAPKGKRPQAGSFAAAG